MYSTLLVSSLLATMAASNPIGTMGIVTKQDVVQKLDSGSQLVALYSSPAYSNPIYVLSLHGESAYDQGFDAAILFGEQIAENYQHLFDALFKDIPKLENKLQVLVEEFLDWQWSDYLSKEVPKEYMDEISGLAAGGVKAGVKTDIGLATSRFIALANLPGDVEDIIFVLLDEFQASKKDKGGITQEELDMLPQVRQMFSKFNGHHCSMFGVWGDRTVDGHLYSARNLDWLTDLGINQYKLITVHHPVDGYSHCTVGYAGVWGALAGMSSEGLTAHEANLESKLSSFQGYPWLLRLRDVMSRSKDLQGAMSMWAATNNTVGFNHMIGSANDQRATAMETMHGYTAYFDSMDPREVDAVDPSTGEIYGAPLSDAVYRTNHGYDPVTQENYQWYGYHAYDDSKRRYMKIHDSFVAYHESNVKIGIQDAITVTSAIGIKGDGTDEDNCNPDLYLKGENILSVTYDPSNRYLYAAFEDGSGENWIPAACMPYVAIDMSQWF